MRAISFLILFMSAVCLLPATSRGQGLSAGQITGVGSVNKHDLDFTQVRALGDASAGTFLATLQNDLKLSGWFRVEDGGNAPLILSGTAQGQGRLDVQLQLNRRANNRSVLRISETAAGASARDLAHKVADQIVKAVTGKDGMASSRILLIGNQSGHKEVHICDADGKEMTQLTHDRSVNLSPNWAPDGNSFVYTSFMNGFPAIYAVNLQSSQRRKLTNFPGLNTSGEISPNGREMIMTLSRDGNPELYLMNMGTLKIERITRSADSAETSPTWSPDGRQIAFVSDSTGAPQIYLMNRDGSGRRRLTMEGRENVSPDWGPDGRIAFSRRKLGKYQIMVMDPLTGKTEQVTHEHADHENPSWAPDGRHIVITHTQGYHSNLYVLDTGGDPPLRLTTLRGDWYAPAWSP
jgi:TolB protein